MKNLVEEEQRSNIIMMLNMTNFLKDCLNIFLKVKQGTRGENKLTPRETDFQKNNLNLEMTVKLQKIK